MTELHYWTLSDLRSALGRGELLATDVTAATLDRIRRLDPMLNGYVRVLEDAAMATASRLDADQRAGRPLGALHGVPVAIKDLLFTRGIPTTVGMPILRDFEPSYDATVVTRLTASGAVIVGKTQLTEGAYGLHHPSVAAPQNPWSAAHWTGVSSSGSGVAVAAGMAYAALGSDTGGSIRFPSACCGLVGMKPTYGRVSRHGAFPMADSLDHIGPMTRTVRDCALVLQVIAGADPNDPTSLADAVPDYVAATEAPIGRLRVGVDWTYVSKGVDAAATDTVRGALDAFASLGAEVCAVEMPPATQQLVAGWRLTCGAECARAHSAYYPARRDEYGPALASLIERGRAVTEQEYAALERARHEMRADLDGLLQRVDVLIAPCQPWGVPRLDELASGGGAESRTDAITFTAPFDYSGHPSLTLRAGIDPNGLPRAFQLVGPHLGEALLLRVGAAYERALGLDAHPPV